VYFPSSSISTHCAASAPPPPLRRGDLIDGKISRLFRDESSYGSWSDPISVKDDK